MNKDVIQSFCRYYKGEDKCPFKDGDKQMFWLSEKWWFKQTITVDYAGCEVIIPLLKEYVDAGLSRFEMYDSVPITLKAILFNRYCKYAESVDIEGFKKFYKTIYIKG